ncbi:cilia- and flagella-associated protein 251-like isoform X2 [Mya arenaria]|uniref:cilia- and flagella-associated protein 251-like isoform X2 n=1 Tax=Mya arenaria TaxID=6604 RepID=UPI0022E2FEFF|nr:cilia- and flagella-associated protein 251-like isoform X2 [Mya arenaria]
MADEEGQKSGSPKPESPQPADPETTDAPGTPTRADAAGRKSKSPEAQEVQESKSPEPAEEGQGDAENVNENAGGEEQTDGDKPTDDGTDETQEQEGEQQEVPAETEEAQQEEQGEEQAGEDGQQAGDDEQQAEAEPAEAGERASPEGEQQQTEVDKAQEESGGKSPTQEQQQPPAGTDARPSSQASLKSQPTERGPLEVAQIPDAPQIPSPDRPESEMEGTMSNAALNIIWSFGLNRNVRVLNLTDNTRKVIMYTCAHVGILYDFNSNRQHILQGHSNPITCTCVSEDKRWLVTGDRGKDSMVIVWDTYTGVPIQTIFDTSNSDEGGVVAVGMTPDAKYLATISAAKSQVLSIWDWTVDGDTPLCSAELKSTYGVQNFILFNPQDIHYLVTNSDSQVVFYNWSNGHMEYFAPPLTDQDFNKQVGRYSQSIFQANSSRALTATSIGNLVVWDNNKPVTKEQMEEIYRNDEVISSEPSANKKALKIIRLQERGINVITTTDKYIVVGDVAGHVKFFDQSLKLVHWYQDLNLGPVSAISFAFNPDFLGIAREGTNYPPDATIQARQFVIRDFVVGSSIAVFGNVTADGTAVKVIHREHDGPIHSLAAHPTQPAVVIGSYSGLLKVWNYEKKQVMVSRTFERGNLIRCCSYSPNGAYLAVGFMNGSVRVLDSITLLDELQEPFRYSRDAITHIEFSHDSKYLATADAEYTVSVFVRQHGVHVAPYVYLGRNRAHYKPIKEIMFGIQLDADFPRLLSLGTDRVLVEYDLERSSKDDLQIASSDRIEQSAVPQCMTWYPPITKEHFIVTANDQFKFKLYNATTKMCRKTLLGPTYGSPVQKMCVIPTKDPARDKRYVAYITEYKVGMNILPLDGNPHNAMALIGHPSGVANMVCSNDGRYLFTAGGTDATVHMWEININALEGQSSLGGADLIPFYGLLEGGREGELFKELEDYFYYAQIRRRLLDESQGVNAMDSREVSVKIPLSEVPFVMRAMGFYPSEQEIEDMLNEVKFSRYVETGSYVEAIDLGEFIKLYINHRPAFGLSPERLVKAFETLGLPAGKAGPAINRGDLLEMLQTKGEHMTEYELAEYLMTLLGYHAEGGSSELQEFDTNIAGDVISDHLPVDITAEMFANEVLGFGMNQDSSQGKA